MGSRVPRGLTFLPLRCLRRQLHSSFEELPRISHQSLLGLFSSSSSVQAGIYGGQSGETFSEKLLELEASRFESAKRWSMKDPVGRDVMSLSPAPDRSKDEWRMDAENGKTSWRVQKWSGEKIVGKLDKEVASVSDQDHDFFSMYVRWRGHDQLNSLAAMRVVDKNGFFTETRQNCNSVSFSGSFSCPSPTLHHSMIIPLEVSSVKRKRKKKMNKHKQRKLRRRDRHRN